MANEEHIVALEGIHCQIPNFDIPHKYTEYRNTEPHEVLSRVKDATIVIVAWRQISIEIAEQAKRLKLIVVMSTGCGWVQKDYWARRGVTVCNCPGSNIESCSGHALGLYFAARRRLVQMHTLATKTDEWAERGTLTRSWEAGPPLSCSQETVAIVGHGALGQAIDKLCRGVGMGEVVVAERKGVPTNDVRSGRESFETLLERATVLMVCCPKDSSTENLIDRLELARMRKEAIVINMARGGIVNERALVHALKERRIYAAATDVLEHEPGERGKR